MNLVLSLTSAFLLILIFPRFNLTWLAPVAIAPLVVACAREGSWVRRAVNGWAAGIVFWAGVCYWIQFVLEVHGGLGVWLGWLTFVLFALFKGLHLAVFAVLAGFVLRNERIKTWSIPAIAALWTGLERTHGPLAFAWMDLGNAAINMPVPMRLAPLVGVYGVSFVFAMVGGAAASLVLRSPRRQLLWLLPLPGLLFLPALPGPSAGTETVRVVQPNIDTEADWTVESLADLERHMAALSHAPGGAPLIVWPEAPAPFYPGSPAFLKYLEQVTRDSHAYLLFGGVARTPRGDPLNSAFLVSPDGAILDRYDKIKLVPFGEFVPQPFGWVNRITHEAGDFASGSRVVVFPLDSHRLGAFICYESAFPDLVRQFVRNGAQVLLNLSNDGYFGATAAREQHLDIVRMRAAENRRWILRATNDGITAMIDPAGRVTEKLTTYQQLGGTMRYSFIEATTAYTQHGDWFAWSCLLAGLAAGAGSAYKKSRTG